MTWHDMAPRPNRESHALLLSCLPLFFSSSPNALSALLARTSLDSQLTHCLIHLPLAYAGTCQRQADDQDRLKEEAMQQVKVQAFQMKRSLVRLKFFVTFFFLAPRSTQDRQIDSTDTRTHAHNPTLSAYPILIAETHATSADRYGGLAIAASGSLIILISGSDPPPRTRCRLGWGCCCWCIRMCHRTMTS
jgi:hypothetical protein